jgi:hypothetical protein
LTCLDHPASEGVAVKLGTKPLKDSLLSIERQPIHEFIDNNVRQQVNCDRNFRKKGVFGGSFDKGRNFLPFAARTLVGDSLFFKNSELRRNNVEAFCYGRSYLFKEYVVLLANLIFFGKINYLSDALELLRKAALRILG